jgi:hypothetical protein
MLAPAAVWASEELFYVEKTEGWAVFWIVSFEERFPASWITLWVNV